MHKLRSENAILNQLTNKVMLNLNAFGLRMLNRIFRDVCGTGIVTIDSEMFLTNTIIKKKLNVATTSSDVFCLNSRERWNSASYSSIRQDYYLDKNTHQNYFYGHQHSLPRPH